MGGGLNTKVKLISFGLAVMLMLEGCFQEISSNIEAKVLIGFGPGMDFCLINIYENGIIEFTSCAINNADLHNDDIIKEVYEKKKIRLSKENKVILDELITAILAHEPIKELGGNDFVEVRALVGDKVYMSVYYNEPAMYYDKNLAKLSYKLVELSPIKVGDRQNPLQVPKN